MDTYTKVIVLIESDWNLNAIESLSVINDMSVLIESDWNLNDVTQIELEPEIYVLIESDWNLNDFILELELELAGSINRIRLEFK